MNIKLNGKENIYEQIVKEYKRFIELGVIRNGEKMPSLENFINLALIFNVKLESIIEFL